MPSLHNSFEGDPKITSPANSEGSEHEGVLEDRDVGFVEALARAGIDIGSKRDELMGLKGKPEDYRNKLAELEQRVKQVLGESVYNTVFLHKALFGVQGDYHADYYDKEEALEAYKAKIKGSGGKEERDLSAQFHKKAA